MPAQREFAYTEKDFRRLQALVREHTGIALSDAKRELVYSRLARRLRLLNIDSFAGYCEMLEEGDTAELTRFVNAITTNLTAFFREPHHFEYLGGTLLPGLLNQSRFERRLRIWSAGCSTGEEPYSIAMTVKEAVKDVMRWDFRILATDIDSQVLATAAAGIYLEDRLQSLDRERLRRWFAKGINANAGKLRVKRELQDVIDFQQLNLMNAWANLGEFDVIFCRNVVIYFDQQTQRTLFERFAERLRPGGYLFLGHSESLNQFTDRFEAVGKTIHRKRS